MAKTKCPSCEAELDIPDDPRMGEMLEKLTDANRLIAELSKRLEKAGEKLPAAAKETAKEVAKTAKRYEGIFFDVDDDEQEDDDGQADGSK